MLSQAQTPSRVFLVEDSDLLCRQISRYVEEIGGFEVAGSAGRAAEAIRAIREIKPDILVVDLQLAEGTGWDVIDAAGKMARHVIILSNSDADTLAAPAAEREVHHVFSKTTQFEQFVDCLVNLPKNS